MADDYQRRLAGLHAKPAEALSPAGDAGGASGSVRTRHEGGV